MSGGFRNPEEFGELTAAELLWVQTGSAGIVLLKDQSSSPSATASYGKLYAKTDKRLYFLNEDNVEVRLGVTVSSSAPANPITNDLWVDTS